MEPFRRDQVLSGMNIPRRLHPFRLVCSPEHDATLPRCDLRVVNAPDTGGNLGYDLPISPNETTANPIMTSHMSGVHTGFWPIMVDLIAANLCLHHAAQPLLNEVGRQLTFPFHFTPRLPTP